MKKIVLQFDYGTWPILLKEVGKETDYDFYESIKNQELKDKIDLIEGLYESCFQNDISEFKWIGLDKDKYRKMTSLIQDILLDLRKEYPDFEIENKLIIDLEDAISER